MFQSGNMGIHGHFHLLQPVLSHPHPNAPGQWGEGHRMQLARLTLHALHLQDVQCEFYRAGHTSLGSFEDQTWWYLMMRKNTPKVVRVLEREMWKTHGFPIEWSTNGGFWWWFTVEVFTLAKWDLATVSLQAYRWGKLDRPISVVKIESVKFRPNRP